MDDLFAKMRYELVAAPRTGEILIRDVKDQPILNAAVTHNVEILVTGDKHFGELDLDTPQIINPSDFKRLYVDK